MMFIILQGGGCTHKSDYEQYQVIDRAWDREKAYYFTFEISDTTHYYDLSLQIRNNNLYPYQNLWLLCTIEQPIGSLLTDTIDCVLADDFGKWRGKGISIFQQKITFMKDYKFSYKGQYTFCFRHGMRCDELKGIEEIGLEVNKSK